MSESENVFKQVDFSQLDILSDAEVEENLRRQRKSVTSDAKLFFSTWLGGITHNISHMVLPLDDHMAHRGDAVFEAVRFHRGVPYLWTAHLQRLRRSADRIGIEWPCTESELTALVHRMIDLSALSDGLIRIYISRGPGGFTVNPYECSASQLYVVLSELKTPSEAKASEGVSVCTVAVPAKEGLMAQVKSCNYLINVLARKEALDHGFEFGVTLTAEGEVTESSTENLLLINAEGHVVFPSWENTLQGTTLLRLWDLLKQDERYKGSYVLSQKKYTLHDVESSQELMLVGTTLAVLPVSRFNARRFTTFKHALVLRSIIQDDLNLLKR